MPSPAWTNQDLTNPHAAADKAQRVERMFAAIATSYDINNRLHSLGRDQAWRRAAVNAANVQPGDLILDIATGTGDLALAFTKTPASKILGLDFTYNMLAVANQKLPKPTPDTTTKPTSSQAGLKQSESPGQTTKIQPPSTLPTYHAGDAMRLPIASNTANVLTIAFGIRNVASPLTALREFHRVTVPGARVVILEFSLPKNPILKSLYNFYFRHIMPRTAALIARDKSGAYKYLPQSVNTFIERDQLVALLKEAGFINITTKPLTFGISVLYIAHKPV